MKTTEFIAYENDAYRLRVTKTQCEVPDDLLQVCLIRELLDKIGNVESSTTHKYFMTQEQLNVLAKGLME
jgi:hypothetical protein